MHTPLHGKQPFVLQPEVGETPDVPDLSARPDLRCSHRDTRLLEQPHLMQPP